MIEIRNVTQHYTTRPVLRDVSVTIEQGQLVAVMGANGMGKSTLLGVIAGTLAPFRGEIAIDGKVRRSTPEQELAIRKRVVYLPDHPWLPSEQTPKEFLLAVGRLYDIEEARLFDHVDRLVDLFHLEDVANSTIHSLSNGQRKKTAIASALVTEAPYLILDEPFTGGLDPSGIIALKHVLRGLADRADTTVVIASQLPEIVEALAHRVIVMTNGKVELDEELSKLTEIDGKQVSLSEALDHIIHSESLERIRRYTEGQSR